MYRPTGGFGTPAAGAGAFGAPAATAFGASSAPGFWGEVICDNFAPGFGIYMSWS